MGNKTDNDTLFTCDYCRAEYPELFTLSRSTAMPLLAHWRITVMRVNNETVRFYRCNNHLIPLLRAIAGEDYEFRVEVIQR